MRSNYRWAVATVVGAVFSMVAAGLAVTPATAAPASGVGISVGSDQLGQLGDPASAGRLVPGPVALPAIVQVASGRDHAYALDTTGRVWAWGANQYGQIGDGTTLTRAEPVRLALTDVVEIEAGHYHGIARRADGSVWSWGYGALGQLGLGTLTNRLQPVQVGGIADARLVSAGRDMSYAVVGDERSVLAWGGNSFGEVGDGTTVRRATPIAIGLQGVIELAGGRDHALAIRSDGTLWSWGDNTYGQIGDGTQTMRTRPVPVALSPVQHVDAGAHHSVAVGVDGLVRTWGRGYRGQLGLGGTAGRLAPTVVPGLSGIEEVGDGRDQTFAVTTGGRVWAWGDNGAGQLGDGTTTRRTSPVLLSLERVATAQGGALHSVFLTNLDGGTNQPPAAALEIGCDGTLCTFDAQQSDDPDGTIVAWRWSFGDGQTATGSRVVHQYGGPGSYLVSVDVVDDDGATTTAQRAIEVTEAPPPPSEVLFRSATSASVNATRVNPAIPGPGGTEDILLLLVTANRSDITLVPSQPGWRSMARVVDDSMVTQSWWAPATDVTNAEITASALAKLDAQALRYQGVALGAPIVAVATAAETVTRGAHSTPAVTGTLDGAWWVGYWADKTSDTTSWVPAPGTRQLQQSVGSGAGRITSLSADLGPVSAGAVAAQTATASSANGKATTMALLLRPAALPPP